MRRWIKYRLNYETGFSTQQKGNPICYTAQDFEGYADGSYSSKEDFFRDNIYNYSALLSKSDRFIKEYLQKNNTDINRYMKYDKTLKNYIQKNKKILSIGSGKCINELLLIERGYDIICSDIKQYINDEILKLFPDLKFMVLDIRSSSIPQKYDYIISLSVFYLFDDKELISIFGNIGKMLNKGGKLIVDFGGGEENFITFIIDEFLCKYEIKARFLIKRFKGESFNITKKGSGFRRTNKEIIFLAEECGFKCLDITTADYDTEIVRSILLTKMANWGGPLRKVIHKIGKYVPYIRMFVFELT